MNKEYSQFLEKIARDCGMGSLETKRAFLNPLENDMFARLLTGALKGLETVALASFDFKLTAIVKLLQVWLNDKRTEIEKSRVQTEQGADAWNGNPYDSNNYMNFY